MAPEVSSSVDPIGVFDPIPCSHKQGIPEAITGKENFGTGNFPALCALARHLTRIEIETPLPAVLAVMDTSRKRVKNCTTVSKNKAMNLPELAAERRLDDATGAQAGDPLGVIAEVNEDLVRVLAEVGRRTVFHGLRRLAEMDRLSYDFDIAELGMPHALSDAEVTARRRLRY